MEVEGRSGASGTTRVLVGSLFVASAVLSAVSWYTTQQGMALYLSPGFSVLASLGIQASLVLVAWLVGLARGRQAVLVAVYVMTATVSIAFSYVSLYTWFSARERPATVQRLLYDTLASSGGRAEELLVAAVAEAEAHALALERMAEAEKRLGFVSRAGDLDPWLGRVRQAVAEEARSMGATYPEGAGTGLRHAAFERHGVLARQVVARLQEARTSFRELGGRTKPLDPSAQQLREFRQVFDGVPWTLVEETLHAGPLDLPEVPEYTDFVDQTATSQEDLLLAFAGLVGAPSARHVTALALATFIDVIVFLLAWATGPLLVGSPEERWVAAGAAVDGRETSLFVRDLVGKLRAGPRGTASVDVESLTPGERQLCLVLTSHRQAAVLEESGHSVCHLDPTIHERLVETLAEPSVSVQAAAPVEG